MRKRLEGLNLLRIILMVWILLFHAKIHFGYTVKFIYLDELISVGAVGVTGFFMISGFVLRYNYGTKLCSGTQIRNYFESRFAGIYPLYIFMLVVALLTHYRMPVSLKQTLLVLPFNMSMLQTFLQPQFANFFYNDNVWYISTAFMLYLLFPALNWILESSMKEKRGGGYFDNDIAFDSLFRIYFLAEYLSTN